MEFPTARRPDDRDPVAARDQVHEEGWLPIPCRGAAPALLEASLQLQEGISSLTVCGLSYFDGSSGQKREDEPEFAHLRTLEAYGQACAAARDKAACLQRVRVAYDDHERAAAPSRHHPFAIMTAGDDVRRVDNTIEVLDVLKLPIDAEVEAVVLAALKGLPIACPAGGHTGTEVSATDRDFLVRTATSRGCGDYDSVSVSHTGDVGQPHFAPVVECCLSAEDLFGYGFRK